MCKKIMTLALAITTAVSGLGMVGTVDAVESNGSTPLHVLGFVPYIGSDKIKTLTIESFTNAKNLFDLYDKAMELAEIDVENTKNFDDNSDVKINAIKFEKQIDECGSMMKARISKKLSEIKLSDTPEYQNH